MEVFRNILSLIWSALFNASVLIFIYISASSLIDENVANSMAALGGAALCGMLGNLDRFKFLELGLSGIKAESREIIHEARVTIDQLRNMAKSLAAIAVELIHSEGRYGGSFTPAEKDRRENQLIEMLKDIGFGQKEISEVCAVANRFHRIDYFSLITARMSRMLNETNFTLWDEFYRPWQEKGERPGPDETAEILSKIIEIDDDERGLIEDYRFFLDQGTHRRPDIWAKRGEIYKARRGG